MVDVDVHVEEERNYYKIFFNMGEKVENIFIKYQKIIKNENKEPKDHASICHEGGGGETPPSLSTSAVSSSSSCYHHSNRHHRHTSKKPFFNLDVKFYLPTYNVEYNA